MSCPHKTTLTDLPPELLDHVVTYLPTASSLSSLGRTNKSLRSFVGKQAWQTFARTRFPSLHPPSSPSWLDTARSLTTLSRAYDRRACVARYVEPGGGGDGQGDGIISHPGFKRVDKWRRPRGQTIGFTPQLDVHEHLGSTWGERREVLAFSAGAEVCIRYKERGGANGKEGERVRWTTYRPLSAFEGRDDVTALHLLSATANESDGGQRQKLITGTANGDLQILTLPSNINEEVEKVYFTTQGRPVRSSSILDNDSEGRKLLAVNLGDSHVALYPVETTVTKIAPLVELDLRPPSVNGHTIKGHKAWSTRFLSTKTLAVGIGPNEHPIRVFSLTPSGLQKDPLRQFSLLGNTSDRTDELAPGVAPRKPMSSVYPIVPLPPSTSTAASGQEGNVFLSGGYDGIVRLHDLRSPIDVEVEYSDPTDDSAIYSLLPHGQESLVAGTSRHSLLKIFDLRLGAKCYDYLDAAAATASSPGGAPASPPNGRPSPNGAAPRSATARTKDYNLFLKPPSTTHTHGRGWGNNAGPRSARANAESSIYNLASPAPHSPCMYAGVENAVVELASTGVVDKYPDAVFFAPLGGEEKGGGAREGGGFRDSYGSKEVFDLAMYDQSVDLGLLRQRSVGETWRGKDQPGLHVAGLDERWKAQ